MKSKGFGTFYGIFVPNVTMMFGVILFLRLTPITSHVGLESMLAILALSLLVMLLTSLSIASIATNMQVGAGGVYYLISRALGIELGGAVGFVIYLAQLISISLTITGFAYLFHEQFPSVSIVSLEIVALFVLTILSGASASWALKIQLGVCVLILTAVATVFFGSTTLIEAPRHAAPFYPGGTLKFWMAFALFYPAMTGIEAGMALSGNLRDPARSFFVGNITSLIFVAVIYGGLAAFRAPIN